MRKPTAISLPTLIALAAGLWGAAILTVGQNLASATGQTPASRTRVDYERQVRPILESSCSECHSQDKRKGGLSLATYADVLEGGRSGAAVRPGNSAGSLILHRVSGETEPQMPKDELPLDAASIALIRLWIDQGARATPSGAPAPAPWEAPLALDRPATPAVRWRSWSSTIDRFVAAYLTERRAMEPASVPDALFARRVYLDVWGLLPEPAELRTFLADRSPAKREALVARLLADDTKYADHWISFWNDLLRNEDGVTYFSESAGRKSITDWLYPALESNLPYDQFVRQTDQPDARDRPRGVRRRRELARRDERGGHALDAGLAEHRADLPGREPEVQCLPRQLRQQVEAEGRVRARRVSSRQSRVSGSIDVTSRRMPTPSPAFFTRS